MRPASSVPSLGQGAHLDDVLHAGPQAGLDRGDLAAFQQVAEARLGRLDGRLVELAALEQVDVLAADRRELVAQVLAPLQVPAQQERRRQQHRQQHGQDDHQREVAMGPRPSVPDSPVAAGPQSADSRPVPALTQSRTWPSP